MISRTPKRRVPLLVKKKHERCPSECGNETISVDMRDDDAEVKVCVDQNDEL